MFTAVANELVRLTFKDDHIYSLLGYQMDGVNVWILFKIALIMPASGLYAYLLTRLMQKHRIKDPATHDVPAANVQKAAGFRTQPNAMEYAQALVDQRRLAPSTPRGPQMR